MHSLFYMGTLNRLARAILLVILVFPLAAFLVRLGMSFDGVFFKGMEAAGQAIFENIDIIFAISIATFMSNRGKDIAPISGAVALLACKATYLYINPDIDTGIFVGVLSGLLASMVHNYVYRALPALRYIERSAVERLAPVATGLLGFLLGLLISQIWPPIQMVISAVFAQFLESPVAGAFIFGTVNRLLIPFGLHHIINSMAWLEVGEYSTMVNGLLVTVKGDIPRYLAGDPTAGTFQTGFYPIMLFGLPAMAYALYKNTKKADRPYVKKVLIAAATSSILFGVTEPIELLFFIAAFRIYLLHAVLTGVSLALCQEMGIAHGFSFSAGIIDYILMLDLSTNSLWLWPLGWVFAGIYYSLTRYSLQKIDVQLGQEERGTEAEAKSASQE